VSRSRLEPLPADRLPSRAFRATRSIRFSDCDPAGIAYTPRIVDLMNGAIEDAFPGRLGLDYHQLIRDDRLGLGYARVDCDFFRPLAMGDEVVATVLIAAVGGASATWRLHLHLGEQEAARGELVMVTTSLTSHRAVRLPDAVRAAFVRYQADCA
jgi:4-hydroxybenzoyl-CoA thioesterase